MTLEKPRSIAANPVKSAKWDEITAGRSFGASDAPTLALLCQWHAIVERCMLDLETDGELQVAYMNNMDDIKALPQIATMKQASAEIRQFNKQLGINDEPTDKPKPKQATILTMVCSDRAKKAKRANGA